MAEAVKVAVGVAVLVGVSVAVLVGMVVAVPVNVVVGVEVKENVGVVVGVQVGEEVHGLLTTVLHGVGVESGLTGMTDLWHPQKRRFIPPHIPNTVKNRFFFIDPSFLPPS